jgi:hypothetical protein
VARTVSLLLCGCGFAPPPHLPKEHELELQTDSYFSLCHLSVSPYFSAVLTHLHDSDALLLPGIESVPC